ncbi:MAG: hypothetical protein QOJ11_1927 [Frankiales bacterium]|nr:hypothetical protein [Frankiales bacterium]
MTEPTRAPLQPWGAPPTAGPPSIPPPHGAPPWPQYGLLAQPLPAAAPMIRDGRQFAFDGGAATYFGTGLLALLITVVTLGICYPFALVLRQRWRAKHSYIDGHRLQFTGSAWGLFGNWLIWFALCVITLGVYSFWVGPRIARWLWENTEFEAPVHTVRHG